MRDFEDAGYWIGLVGCALLAGLGMVQLRSWLGAYPSGDWPVHGITWHLAPALAVALSLWWTAAQLLGRPLEAVGRAAAPLLGLVVTWTWYGVTDPDFHAAGGCDVYPICHDSGPFLVVWWAAPWFIWAAWRIYRLQRSDSPPVMR